MPITPGCQSARRQDDAAACGEVGVALDAPDGVVEDLLLDRLARAVLLVELRRQLLGARRVVRRQQLAPSASRRRGVRRR